MLRLVGTTQSALLVKMELLVLTFSMLIGLSVVTTIGAEETPGATARTARYVIGLSPFLDNAVKDDVYRRIVGFLLEDAPLNSSLQLYDAYNLQTITQAKIPTDRAFRSAKTRANQFKEQIRKLKEFLAAKHEMPGTNTFKLQPAIRFPQFMDFIGENLRGSSQPVVVIVLGSPLYLDHKELGFSMVDGYYFKDHRSSPQREYEFIEFESPVDVWQVQAMVNLYEGTAPGGAFGEIRIEFDGKIFAGQFSLPATHGNKGRSGRNQGDFWTRIDVPTILKLPESRRDAALSRPR